MLKKGGGGWSVVRVPDSALVPEGAGVRAAGGLYVGVCVCEACGFVCGVGELLGWYGAECTCAARGLFSERVFVRQNTTPENELTSYPGRRFLHNTQKFTLQ